MDLLKARNVGTKPYTFFHDRDGDVTLKPGQERIISLAQGVVALGNPAAIDVGRNRLREAERAQVYSRHGFYPGLHPDGSWYDAVEVTHNGVTETIGPFCPAIEIYDLDDERVFMVHDDLFGERGTHATAVVDERAESDLLRSRIERLEALLASSLATAAVGQTVESDTPDKPDVAAGGDDGDDSDLESEIAAEMAKLQAQGTAVPPPPPGSSPVKPPEEISQAERNRIRDDIPPPPPGSGARKDSARSGRTGAQGGTRPRGGR